MDEKTVKLNQIYTKGITLSTSTKINTLPFSDNQVIIPDSENNLQREVFTLQNMAKRFWNVNIKRKISDDAIFRTRPVRSEIILGNKRLQQVKNFKCRGHEISYENGKDNQQKLAKYSQILKTINNTFKPAFKNKSI
jgi:hypothetical protein